MLPLTQIQQRHGCGLLVLRRVSLQNLIDETEVLFGKFEGNRGVVVRCVSVLPRSSAHSSIPPSSRLYHIERRATITYHLESI